MSSGLALTSADRWRQKLLDQGKPIVSLQTHNAVWDICGIETDDGSFITISWMGQSNKSKMFSRKTDKIDWDDVQRMRYYANE